MPVSEMMALAELAAGTVTAAAATDAWGKTKQGLARLLGRGDQRRAEVAAGRLESSRAELAGSSGADLERVRAQVAATWRVRFADLLEEDPRLAADLRSLVEEIRAALPAGTTTATGHGLAAGRDVTITASGGGVAAGIIHGDVAPPDPTVPGPAEA